MRCKMISLKLGTVEGLYKKELSLQLSTKNYYSPPPQGRQKGDQYCQK